MPIADRAFAIQAATEDDLERVLEITNEAIRHTTANWSLEPTTLDERRAWFRAHQQRGQPILVVRGEDGRVLGYGAYGDFRSRAGYRYTVEHSLYVDAAERGRGLGSALLAALIAHAARAGVHVMMGGIDGDNLGSIRLHERFGFVEVGRLRQVGRKFDRWLDLVLMQRILSPADAKQP